MMMTVMMMMMIILSKFQILSGKFYEAALEITKAAAQAHAASQMSPDKGVDVIKLRKYLKVATKKKNTGFARSALARTLYGFFKVRPICNRQNATTSVSLNPWINRLFFELFRTGFEISFFKYLYV